MAKEKKIEFPNPNFQLYERVDDEKHMLKYEGSYNFMGVKAVFSVTDQYPFNLKTPSNRVNCRYRGTASIRDPQRNGKVLRLQGEKAACALNNYYMNHPGEKLNPKTESDVLKIAETINFNGESAQELAEFIFSKSVYRKPIHQFCFIHYTFVFFFRSHRQIIISRRKHHFPAIYS